MRRSLLSTTLALVTSCLVLAACQAPTIHLSEMPKNPFDVPRPQGIPEPATQPAFDPNASETDEIPLYDLAASYGLDVSIDMVTGRRTCTDGTNRVVVMPSGRSITINGKEHPLHSMIRWRAGVLTLPGEARSLLADGLTVAAIPDVPAGSNEFDGRELDLADWQHAAPRASMPRSAPTSAPAAPAAERAVAPGSLPAAWRSPVRREWRYLVIHHSATSSGGALSFGREHQRKWPNGLGYHFVVGNGTDTRDGEIEVGPRWKRQGEGIDGGHAGNELYNKYGIGICIVGDFNTGRPSAKQLAALRSLCRALMARYGIARDHVVPHCDVRRGHTDCPGKHFPLAEFIASL